MSFNAKKVSLMEISALHNNKSQSFGKMVSIRRVMLNGEVYDYRSPEKLYKVAQALSHLMQRKGCPEIKMQMAQIMPDFFVNEGWQPVSVMRLNNINRKVNILTGEEAMVRRNIFSNSLLSKNEKAQKAAVAISKMIKEAFSGYINIDAKSEMVKQNGKLREKITILSVNKTQ